MKKIIITATILGTLISTSAFAKTQGSYAGLDFINTNMKVDSIKYQGKKIKIQGNDSDNSNTGSLGINYKYAFNTDKFFIAPGLFFDHSDASIKTNSNEKLTLNYRYGIKFDLGYDITDKFAAYLIAGYANNNYKADFTANGGGKGTGNDFSTLYGLGAKYSIRDNVDLNLAYERSAVAMKSPFFGEDLTTNVNIQMVRLGASYKF